MQCISWGLMIGPYLSPNEILPSRTLKAGTTFCWFRGQQHWMHFLICPKFLIYQFPIAAVIHCHKFSGLRQQNSLFWRSEVKSQSHRAKVKVLVSLVHCLFSRRELATSTFWDFRGLPAFLGFLPFLHPQSQQPICLCMTCFHWHKTCAWLWLSCFYLIR